MNNDLQWINMTEKSRYRTVYAMMFSDHIISYGLWNGGFDVASNTGEIATHFTYSETRLKHKLNGSTLVGVNVKEVPLNEGLH